MERVAKRQRLQKADSQQARNNSMVNRTTQAWVRIPVSAKLLSKASFPQSVNLRCYWYLLLWAAGGQNEIMSTKKKSGTQFFLTFLFN